jgi:eukaryotic-like serine/threonine-protein kinase
MTRAWIWERWHEVDRVFALVLERPPGERQRFLADTCGDDRDLLEMVTGLVADTDRASRDLPGPGRDLLRSAFGGPAGDESDSPPPALGDLIGHYRLVRELGRGGMATVYEAERADGAYVQRVAIKLLRRRGETNDVAQRLQAETRILSTLAHPHIARLVDAGTAADGRPFLVMELVEGEPITAWADRVRLGVTERLALFLQIADAVSFAHARLVVHRDLKPSNVLVEHDGCVKLLDFGIAKLLEPGGSPATDSATTSRWLTPAYAAPEQILGRAVTTATDVHGLGVLLYELLSGRRPFGGDGLSRYDLERAVCDHIPPRPSAAVAGSVEIATARNTDAERLRRRLVGDLDAILSKALRKNPEDRYPSAQAMAVDVERHRSGFPVEARAGLRAYRVRKFVRRHWLVVGAAIAIALVLVSASLALWRLQAATARARDLADRAATRATEEADNARLVTDFLAEVFRGRNPELAPPDTVTARELLAWGRERVDTEFAQRPALQAALFQVLGSAYFNLGLIDKSVELHTRAVEVTRRVSGDRSEEVAARLLVLSAALSANRDFAAALPRAREALDIRLDQLEATDPRIAEALAAVATAHLGLGHPDSAEPLLRRAIDVWRTHGGVNDSAYVSGLLALAPVLRAQGALDDAQRLYEEAIPKYRALGGSRDALAPHLNNLAYLLRTKGEYARAESLYREAWTIQTELYGRGHPSSLTVANNLAAVLAAQGDTTGALGILREVVAAAQAQWPDDHWRVGNAHAALGRALLGAGHYDEAFAELREARRVYVKTLGPEHDWTFFVEATLAAEQVARGQVSRGRPYLDQFYRFLSKRERRAGTPAEHDLIGQLKAFVQALDALGLDDDAQRFGALMSPSPGQGSDSR